MSLEQLAQIQVTTPNKAPESAFNTPAAVYVLTGDQIRRAGVRNIPDALRLVPGVEVAQIDASKWSVGIRGFGSRLSRSVLVLIDGRTVYTTLLAGTYWEVQDLVLADIDRIEVIRGPGGTIWGPNAVNGVINIITKKAADTQGTLAELGGGSDRWGETNIRYGGSHGSATSYRVFGKAFVNGPEYHPDGLNFDEWRAIRGGFRLDHKLQNDASFTLEGDIYYEVTGQAVSATTYNPPNTYNAYGNADLSGGDIVGSYKRKLHGDIDFQLETYYSRDNRHELNFTDLRDTFDVDTVFHQHLGRRHDLTYGAGARFSYGRNPVVVTGLYFDPESRLDRLLSGFIQDDIQLVENRLDLTIGTKLLNTNFAPFNAQPSARLMWTPSRNTGFWLAFTHAVRTPSDGERDFFLSSLIGTADGLPFFARFNANRNFQSEQLNGYEAGFRQLIGKKVYVDVATFFNRYLDLFSENVTGAPYVESIPAPTHVLLPAEFGNGLQGQTKGIEIAPEWQATSFWRLRGSYSYLHMNIEKGPGSMDIGTAPSIMGSSPQHEVSADSAFDIRKSFELDLIVRYVSALPAQSVPAYTTGDANFQWNFSPHLGLTVTGRNLFQPHHPEFSGDPGPLVEIKRSVYAQVSWTR